MPIDASIPLAVEPVKFNDPFAVLEKYRADAQERQLRQQQIQSNQALEEERRQKIGKEAQAEAVRKKFFNIIATSTDPTDAETRIKTEAPELLSVYQEQRQKSDKLAADISADKAKAKEAQAALALKGQEYAQPLFQMVKASGNDPKVFAFAVNTAKQHFEDFPAEAMLAQAGNDPAKIAQIIQGFESPQQQNANTTAQRLQAEMPKMQAESQIATQVAAGTQGGLTPDQQRQKAQSDRQAGFEQQRLALENRRLNKPDNDTGRMDRSYTQANSSLETIRKPLADQMERFGRLAETVNQSTPQADALIAPELLTVMAGGAGSGLRMNEAEISRIIGGRSKFEDLKAAVNKWQLDPSKALSVTPAQRQQIRDLMGAVQKRTDAKLALVNKASQALIDAPDVETQRRIIADTRKQLDDVGSAAPSTGGLKILSIEKVQ